MKPTTPYYKLHGCNRVLIVEDLVMNQELIKEIMLSWGMQVAVAANGIEAIKIISEEDFDVVLMDIQMPEMDGMEATRLIRNMPDPCKSKIPIIAVTANLLKGDTERYLDAGMSDCIAKPLEEKKLFTLLCNYFKGELINACSHGTHKNCSAQALYDLSMVKAVSGGDEGFVRNMILLFLETVPVILDQMQTASDHRNWEQTSKLAHKLKSTIDSMSIYQLQELIRKIEADGKKGEHVEHIPAAIVQLRKGMNACILQVKSDFGLA